MRVGASTRPWPTRTIRAGAALPAKPGEDDDPHQLALWTEFHDKIAELPADERDLFDFLWYQELTQAEVATMLGVSDRTVKCRWAAARLALHERLGGALPES